MASDQALVGRSTELERVLSLFARVEQGRGAVGLIEGEAGIGKTAVLEATLAAMAPRGYLVLRGAASELEGDRPFAALAEAMGIHHASADPERVGIARLLLGEANPSAGDLSRFAEVRFRLIESIVSLTERLGLAGPVLLALEDLHWADSSTLLAVHHIGRRLASLPVVLLATYRPSPRSAILDRVTGDLVQGGGLHVVLGPLDHAAVVTLVAGLARAAPTATLLAATAQAGGNPLFIKELIAALHADGTLQIIDGRAEADIRVIPYSFRRLILRQLVTLPDTTRRILRVAAVLGSSFSLTELAIVLGRLPSDLLDDLDEAFRAKILDETREEMSLSRPRCATSPALNATGCTSTSPWLSPGFSPAIRSAPGPSHGTRWNGPNIWMMMRCRRSRIRRSVSRPSWRATFRRPSRPERVPATWVGHP